MFKEIAEEWLWSRKDKVKRISYYSYENMLHGTIFPIMGECSMDEVCKFSYMKALARDLKEKYSDETIDNIFNIVKCIINYDTALNMNDIGLSEKKRIYDYTFAEARRIISQATEGNKDFKKLGIVLIMYTGMTVSEIAALKWGCFDMLGDVIVVNEIAYRAKNDYGRTEIVYEETEPRRIPIAKKLKEIIRKYKADDVAWDSEHFVLTDSEKIMEPRLFQMYVKKFFSSGYEKGELKKIRTSNDMRSMFIVLALKRGVSPISLSHIVGTTLYYIYERYGEYIQIPDAHREMRKLGY